MDYRKLIWKYIEHVRAMEGVSFVYSAEVGEHPDDFTEREIELLEILASLGSRYEH